MHQFFHKKLPDIFYQYFTNSNDIFKYSTHNSVDYSLYLPQFSSNRTQQSFKYVGPQIWNNIPGRFKQLISYPIFKFFFTNNTS